MNGELVDYATELATQAFDEWWDALPDLIPTDPRSVALLAFLQGAAWATGPDPQDEGPNTF